MPVAVVVGGQFGDEGNGRVVDNLVQRGYKNVIRYNGANNAGHTVVHGRNKYKLNVHPSIVEEGGTAIIGNGVLVDPEALIDNISEIKLFAYQVVPARVPVSDQELLMKSLLL